MMLAIVVNVVWSVVRNFTNATRRGDESDDEPW